MSDKARAAIERNLKAAEEQAAKWREALATYDAAVESAFEAEMVRLNPPRSAVINRINKRQRVGPDIQAAIDSIPEGQEFTLPDVFDRFSNKALDYETSRPSISIWLGYLAQEGKLKKIKRGKYIKEKSA